MDKKTFDSGIALKTGNKIFYYESRFFDMGKFGISIDDNLHRPFDYYDYLKCENINYDIFYKDPDFDPDNFSPEIPVDILDDFGFKGGGIVKRCEFERIFEVLRKLST